MTTRISIIFYCVLMAGCFRQLEPLPSIPIEQEIFFPTTPEICGNVNGAFDHYIFNGYPESDSTQWFQILQGDTTFLGTGNSINVSVSPSTRQFFCYHFLEGDTLMSQSTLYNCVQGLYIPNSFSPPGTAGGDGLNDCFRIKYSLYHNPTSEVYWKIMSTDGVVLFETGSLDECWNGEFNGSPVATGTYLLYLKIDFENNESYIYSSFITLTD